MSRPSWDIVIHRSAERELSSVTGESGDELLARLKQLQYYQQPTEATYVKMLSDDDHLWRVEVDGYRAICWLNKPQIEVLAVDTRSRIYDRIETAKNRAGMAD